MKKVVTLFLLFVFLLNVLGFYGVFLGLQLKNEADAIQALNDSTPSSEEEFTFKLPLTVPYYTDPNAEFQRVDGDFEHDGEIYRMVKQKLHNDTLVVVCIKDKKGKAINDAMSDYVKTFSGKASSEKNSAAKTISFIKDYVSSIVSIEHGQIGWNEAVLFAQHTDLRSESVSFAVDSPPRVG